MKQIHRKKPYRMLHFCTNKKVYLQKKMLINKQKNKKGMCRAESLLKAAYLFPF